MAFVFFVWAKLTLRALFREMTVGVAKRKTVSSASFSTTYATRCTLSLRITLTPELICASLKAICGLNTRLVFVEATSLYERVTAKEKERVGQVEACHCESNLNGRGSESAPCHVNITVM